MNYVDDRTVPICICCGAELLPDVGEDATGMACDRCFRESEAAAATARQAEAADEFRWMSREWFKQCLHLIPKCSDAEKFQWQARDWFLRTHLERLPMLRNQFGDLR